MSQPQGGYNAGQPNQPGQNNQMYNPQMMPRMQPQPGIQQMNYGQGMQYPHNQMLGQPGPQLPGMPGQPRSPMVHPQGSTTGQPSPMAAGPGSHMGPGSIGPPSTGPHSVHGAPHSVGPSSVVGAPSSLTGPNSTGPSSVYGGPSSVLGGSTGPLSNLAPHSVGGGPLSVPGNPLSVQGGPLSVPGNPLSVQGGPLSIQGGPASAGDFLANPLSVQQPLSVPRIIEDPRSVGPHSINQPVTPMNPSSTQMPSSHTPATPGQGLKQEVPEPSVLLATDPQSNFRDLILKDLRHVIVVCEICPSNGFQKHNNTFAECVRESRGESLKPQGQAREECIQAHDNLLAVMDDLENSLTVLLEAPKQASRLEKPGAEKFDVAIQQAIMQKNKSQEVLKMAVAQILQTRDKIRARQDKFKEEQCTSMDDYSFFQ